MAISRKEKARIIERLQTIIKEAKSVVFVNFRGLSVAQATALRNELRNRAVGYIVAKKTLIRKVLLGTKIKGNQPELAGEIALAFGDDLLEPAKNIHDFHRKSDQLEIIGGIFDGEYKDKQAMLSIAQIPPREVLYGRFVNLINWPIRGLVIALDQVAKNRQS